MRETHDSQTLWHYRNIIFHTWAYACQWKMNFYWAAHTGIKYVIHVYIYINSGIYTHTLVLYMLIGATKDSSVSLSLSLSVSIIWQKKMFFFLPVAGCLVAYCCAAGIYIYTAALTWHESVFFSFNYAKNNKTHIETFRQHIKYLYI